MIIIYTWNSYFGGIHQKKKENTPKSKNTTSNKMAKDLSYKTVFFTLTQGKPKEDKDSNRAWTPDNFFLSFFCFRFPIPLFTVALLYMRVKPLVLRSSAFFQRMTPYHIAIKFNLCAQLVNSLYMINSNITVAVAGCNTLPHCYSTYLYFADMSLRLMGSVTRASPTDLHLFQWVSKIKLPFLSSLLPLRRFSTHKVGLIKRETKIAPKSELWTLCVMLLGGKQKAPEHLLKVCNWMHPCRGVFR